MKTKKLILRVFNGFCFGIFPGHDKKYQTKAPILKSRTIILIDQNLWLNNFFENYFLISDFKRPSSKIFIIVILDQLNPRPSLFFIILIQVHN